MTESRNGLVVDTALTQATGTAEREAACAMLGELPGNHAVTVGADKAYDTTGFVAEIRRLGVTPHVAQNTTRHRSAIDGRTARHAGYGVSQRLRKRIEEVFGWIRSAAAFRRTRHRGTERVGRMFTSTAASSNLVRLRRLLAVAACLRRPCKTAGQAPKNPQSAVKSRNNQQFRPNFRSLLDLFIHRQNWAEDRHTQRPQITVSRDHDSRRCHHEPNAS